MLFVVSMLCVMVCCCLLHVACWLWVGVCWASAVVRCCLFVSVFVICCLLLVGSCLLFGVCRVLIVFAMCCLVLFVMWYSVFAMLRLLAVCVLFVDVC